MKKLKIALTLLFALSCSLFLFACGGKDKAIQDITLSGQKETFREGEEFSVGDLKVVVKYRGSDERVTLTSEQYDVDSSAYNKDLPGTYAIIITPKDQPEDAVANTASYNVSVEHVFTADPSNPDRMTCTCGAVRETFRDLTSQIVAGAWDATAGYNAGSNPYTRDGMTPSAPVAGEDYVAIDTLVSGQSLKLTLRIDAVNTGDNTNTWNTPLMGIRNGAQGVLPREDLWVIGVGPNGTFSVPEGGTADGGPVGGSASESSDPWITYSDGSTWTSADMAPTEDGKFATDVIEYNYQLNGVFVIRHTLTTADGSRTLVHTYSLKVPDASYELVGYGEWVTYTIIEAQFTADREIKTFTATDPTVTKQPEGKMFDATGITTEATFSKGDPVKDSYNLYAYDASGARVNLKASPLTAGMYDFHADFGGKQYYFTKNHEQGGESLVEVIPTWISGAADTVFEENGKAYTSTGATYDYTLNSSNTISLVASGAATKASGSLTDFGDYYLAFRLIGSRAFDKIEISEQGAKGNVLKGENGLNNADVIVPIGSSLKTFNITLTKNATAEIPDDPATEDVDEHVPAVPEQTFTFEVNVEDLAHPAVSAELKSTTFTLDAGGDYTVEFSGLTSAQLSDTELYIYGKGQRKTLGDAKKGNADLVPGVISIKSATVDGDKLTVVYHLEAPSYSNLTAADCKINAHITLGSEELASIELYYNLEASENAIAIGDNTFAVARGNKLILVKPVSGSDIRDGAEMTATVNVQNEKGTNYNLGVIVKGGVATFADNNDLTLSKQTSAKLLVLGGNVNDSNDYDHGALLVVVAHLPEIGVRETDRSATYYFTANEDTVNGTSSLGTNVYKIYKVEEDTITGEDVTASGERVQVVPFDCLTDGVQAYFDEAKNFYYGVLIVPASGAHTFGEYVENIAECSVCGAKSYLIKDETAGYDYNVIALPANTPVVNPDTSADSWWADPTADTLVSGNFVVHYTWTNTDANYPGDGAIEMHDAAVGGEYFGFRTFEADYNPAFGSQLSKGVTEKHVFEHNGEVVDEILGTNDLKPADEDGWKGVADVTVIRIGSELRILQHLETKNDVFDVTSTFTGFPTKDIYIHINGNHYFCDDIKLGLGTVTSTQDVSGKMVIGEEDNSHGYTAETPLWKMSFAQGTKVTVTGKHTSTAAANWNTVLAYLYTPGEAADDAKLNFRADNWINSDGVVGDNGQEGNAAYQFKIEKNLIGYGDNVPEGDFWVNFLKIVKDCTATITWDWTNAAQIIVSYAFTDGTYTFSQSYTVTALTGHLETSYTIGLGVDGAYFNATELIITE